MCVVCQGAVPHPTAQEIPLYMSMLQLGMLLVLGYWYVAKMKVVAFFRDTFTGLKKTLGKK